MSIKTCKVADLQSGMCVLTPIVGASGRALIGAVTIRNIREMENTDERTDAVYPCRMLQFDMDHAFLRNTTTVCVIDT